MVRIGGNFGRHGPESGRKKKLAKRFEIWRTPTKQFEMRKKVPVYGLMYLHTTILFGHETAPAGGSEKRSIEAKAKALMAHIVDIPITSPSTDSNIKTLESQSQKVLSTNNSSNNEQHRKSS
jgi:hypothetical protein